MSFAPAVQVLTGIYVISCVAGYPGDCIHTLITHRHVRRVSRNLRGAGVMEPTGIRMRLHPQRGGRGLDPWELGASRVSTWMAGDPAISPRREGKYCSFRMPLMGWDAGVDAAVQMMRGHAVATRLYTAGSGSSSISSLFP